MKYIGTELRSGVSKDAPAAPIPLPLSSASTVLCIHLGNLVTEGGHPFLLAAHIAYLKDNGLA